MVTGKNFWGKKILKPYITVRSAGPQDASNESRQEPAHRDGLPSYVGLQEVTEESFFLQQNTETLRHGVI